MRGMRVRSIASLLAAGCFIVALAAVAPQAFAQCYPGLACPTEPQQQPQPGGGGASSGGARGGVEYHYVGDVRPPDDWLSLRTVPSDKGGARVMKMPAGTLFKVTEKRGTWWHVELQDGQTGWAHSNWIRCCKYLND
jgi:hypothetical protein